MELDFDDTVTLGLRGYVRSVTRELGLTGECSYVQPERPAGAYLALEGRLPGFPDRDVALVWDERHGWSVAVETSSGEDLVVRAHFDGDTVPAPRAVARWVTRLLREAPSVPSQPSSAVEPEGDIAGRLVPYAAAALVPLPREA
jgi:hypothetical protein